MPKSASSGVPAVEQDVLRLDVPVHHALRVGVGQRVGDLAGELERLGDRQAALAIQPLPEAFAPDVGHDVVEAVQRLVRPQDTRVVELEDMRVIELRQNRDLPAEPSRVGGGGQLRPKQLERDRAVELPVVRQVHGRDRAPAKLPLDRIARQRSPPAPQPIPPADVPAAADSPGLRDPSVSPRAALPAPAPRTRAPPASRRPSRPRRPGPERDPWPTARPAGRSGRAGASSRSPTCGAPRPPIAPPVSGARGRAPRRAGLARGRPSARTPARPPRRIRRGTGPRYSADGLRQLTGREPAGELVEVGLDDRPVEPQRIHPLDR